MSTTSESVVSDGVIVSKVAIVFAATKREAGIIFTIQASAIATAQPDAVAASVVNGIASNEIVLW